jgi:hypothetical protein
LLLEWQGHLRFIEMKADPEESMTSGVPTEMTKVSLEVAAANPKTCTSGPGVQAAQEQACSELRRRKREKE